MLVQIEDKAFESKPRFFKAFKSMDTDNDGYVSYKDFEKHLLKNKINKIIANLMMIAVEILFTMTHKQI